MTGLISSWQELPSWVLCRDAGSDKERERVVMSRRRTVVASPSSAMQSRVRLESNENEPGCGCSVPSAVGIPRLRKESTKRFMGLLQYSLAFTRRANMETSLWLYSYIGC